MHDSPTFRELVDRIRQGDSQATSELIRRYEADLRLIARIRLRTAGMRRALDSMDVCQSVFANFFLRAAGGEFELETPAQVLKLLASMVRNRVVDVVRMQRAARRDRGRDIATPLDELGLAAAAPTPSQIVSADELWRELDRRLAPDEREIWRRRQEGQTWETIARETGGSAEAIRKQLTRALSHIAAEIGLGDSESSDL
jgi:RNA polymerase sigma-70 factor (ECF subfamily)